MEGLRSVKTTIIGGGLSGLFAASAVAALKNIEFVLISPSKAALGGYAVWGDMKIGLPPAGRSTAEWLGNAFYSASVSHFLDRFGKYLKPAESLVTLADSLLDPDKSLTQKYYESYILSRADGQALINAIAGEIDNHTRYDEVTKVILEQGKYLIRLKSGSEFRSDKIIIASGRDPQTMKLLTTLGQRFESQTKPLVGCRATFNPESIEGKFNQLDLRLEDTNTCQTYCFNYRGTLHHYLYSGSTIYCGTLNPFATTGNTFIGIESSSTPDVLKWCTGTKRVSLSGLRPETCYDSNTMQAIMNFIETLKTRFGLEFHKFYFPALERFWPQPTLHYGSLKSANLPDLFFIGDASGIAFGVLQCYITALFAIQEMQNKETRL